MKAYGAKKNHNFSDDFIKGNESRRVKTQRKLTKIMHRFARRVAKQKVNMENA